MVSPVSETTITVNDEEGVQLDFREDGAAPYTVEADAADYLNIYLNSKEIKGAETIERESATLHVRTDEETISNSEDCTIMVHGGSDCTLQVRD